MAGKATRPLHLRDINVIKFRSRFNYNMRTHRQKDGTSSLLKIIRFPRSQFLYFNDVFLYQTLLEEAGRRTEIRVKGNNFLLDYFRFQPPFPSLRTATVDTIGIHF